MPDVSSSRAAFFLGSTCLLSLAVVNLITSASTERVLFFGRQTHIGCWFKDRFHSPCPICGLTRSIVLTLHGSLQEAFNMHIAGPLALVAIVVFGSLMLCISVLKRGVRASGFLSGIELKILSGMVIYFAGVTALTIIYWICRLAGHFVYLPELQ